MKVKLVKVAAESSAAATRGGEGDVIAGGTAHVSSAPTAAPAPAAVARVCCGAV